MLLNVISLIDFESMNALANFAELQSPLPHTRRRFELWRRLRRMNIRRNEIIILCRWFCADAAKWINIERGAILSTKTAQFSRNFMNYFSSNCYTIGKLALAIKTLSFGGSLRRIFMDRWRSSVTHPCNRIEVIPDIFKSAFTHFEFSQRLRF